MRLAAPALCVALLVGGATGCTSAPAGPAAERFEGAFDDFEAHVEALPGVVDATLTESPSGAQVNLVVVIDEAATTSEIETIGVEAAALRESPMPAGVYPGQVELRFGHSAYSYFALPTSEALRAQLAYWSDLARTGVDAVNMRTYSGPVTVPATETPATSSSSGAPVLLNSPTGRFVSLVVPDDSTDELRATMASIAAVRDPGAAVGEWHVVSSTGEVKAEFVGPRMPDRADVDTAIALAEGVHELTDASLVLRIDRSGDEPFVAAELTAFDAALDDQQVPTFADALRATPIWPTILRLVETLDATGADFELTVLSNALDDTGNFVLGVGVTDCRFEGDNDWPGLSADLAAHWHSTHAQRPGPHACGP